MVRTLPVPPRAATGALSLDWRARLRALPVFPSGLPEFDPDAVTGDPMELAASWLDAAISAGIAQPHSATWSTVDAVGAPSSRTMILKDLTPDGFWFATPSDSPKGRDLAHNDRIALHFYWPTLGRQLRVTGTASEPSRELSLADWAARSPEARAASSSDTWTAYLLDPETLEFFAASATRAHIRLEFRREGGDWTRQLLAP